jgi:hypothetical protein
MTSSLRLSCNDKNMAGKTHQSNDGRIRLPISLEFHRSMYELSHEQTITQHPTSWASLVPETGRYAPATHWTLGTEKLSDAPS